MTDVERLLAEATPLPWVVQQDNSGNIYIDSHYYSEGPYPVAGMAHHPTHEDAKLIVYAVNRLPAYEAAVEALTEIERTAKRWLDGSDPDARGPMTLIEHDARAALARLRETVPA